jgi:hypothetical protein
MCAVITRGEVILLMTQFCDMPEWHLQIARSADTFPYWSDRPAYLCFSANQNARGLARATSLSLN